MKLCWDGLQVRIPAGMEATALDRGFIRLADQNRQSVELRFDAEKSRFDPHRDGQRLLRAAGLGEAPLEVCREAWCEGLQAEIMHRDRLYVLRFQETRGVAAVLFSAPPAPEALRSLLKSLDWTPPDRWRVWSCFDLRFETPPNARLRKAIFRPGVFRLDFGLNSSQLTFHRLAPADVLLADADLSNWLSHFLRREYDFQLSVTSPGEKTIRFFPRHTWLKRIVSRLPGTVPLLRGAAKHDALHNKILVLTERGRPCPQPVFDRLDGSYASTTIQG